MKNGDFAFIIRFNNANAIQGLRSKSVEPSLAKEASVTRELFKDREFTPAREEVRVLGSIIGDFAPDSDTC